MRRHWEYLIARYAALPVVWCAAGEALMPYYLNPLFANDEEKERFRSEARRFWSDMIRHIRAYDPYERPVTMGRWRSPRMRWLQDWVLVLERKG